VNNIVIIDSFSPFGTSSSSFASSTFVSLPHDHGQPVALSLQVSNSSTPNADGISDSGTYELVLDTHTSYQPQYTVSFVSTTKSQKVLIFWNLRYINQPTHNSGFRKAQNAHFLSISSRCPGRCFRGGILYPQVTRLCSFVCQSIKIMAPCRRMQAPAGLSAM
jgi:hypothetical protein